MLMGILLIALGGAITGFILLGDSWFQLLIAGALGLIFTQFAFLAHEASHRQVFESGPANDRTGRAIAAGVVGISYAWWMTKHTRHHANPNKVGKDPDIDFDTISFIEVGCREAARPHGAHHPQAGLPVLPAAHARGPEPALHARSARCSTADP